MRNTRIFRGLVIGLILFASSSKAQEIVDTARYVVARGEDMRFILSWTSANHGLIQWQVFAENDTWTEVPLAVTKNLRVTADTNAMYRAKITSGSCDPVYSGITVLKVLNIRTLKIDSLTDTRAIVFCQADTSAVTVIEKGVLIDTKAVPDSNSFRISDPKEQTTFSLVLGNLVPGKKYYVRVYEKLLGGKLLMGNVLDFTTYKIGAINRINVTDSTAAVNYWIIGDTASVAHGIFYNTEMPDTNSLTQPGIPEGKNWKSILSHLKAGTSYYAVPYFRKYNTYHLGVSVHFTTYSDYSKEVIDTSAMKVAHKISWKPYATAKKISQPGFYADYGRVKRVGQSDTLLLVYHGGSK